MPIGAPNTNPFDFFSVADPLGFSRPMTPSPSSEIQTHFVHTISPAHLGDLDILHQDVHTHLAGPDNSLIERIGPIAQLNHVPLHGQTTLDDFALQIRPGLPPVLRKF